MVVKTKKKKEMKVMMKKVMMKKVMMNKMSSCRAVSSTPLKIKLTYRLVSLTPVKTYPMHCCFFIDPSRLFCTVILCGKLTNGKLTYAQCGTVFIP